jgi:hypothetical protein
MPIVGYWCRRCEEVVQSSHWAPWACRAVEPQLVARIAAHKAGRPKGWSVTELKGCLRERVIMDTRPVIVDPLDFLKMELGTAWDRYLTEGEKRVRWYGVLGGMEVSGEPDGWLHDAFDRVSVDNVIWDFKNGMPRWTRAGYTAQEDHRWQVSVYAHLSPYMFDYGVIYYNAYGEAAKHGGIKVELIRSEKALLDYVIDDDGLTVAGNINYARQLDDNPAEYPLTGTKQRFGKKTKCDYCVVRAECRTLEGA